MLGCTPLVSEWALGKQIGINSEHCFVPRFSLVSYEQSMMDWERCWWCWLAEWELCGGELGAQGASWNLVIGQRSIKVQCVWSLSVAPFSCYVLLNLSLREDRIKQLSQLRCTSSFDAMSSCFLTFTVTPTLFFSFCFCSATWTFVGAFVQINQPCSSNPELEGWLLSTNVWKETTMCKQMLGRVCVGCACVCLCDLQHIRTWSLQGESIFTS